MVRRVALGCCLLALVAFVAFYGFDTDPEVGPAPAEVDRPRETPTLHGRTGGETDSSVEETRPAAPASIRRWMLLCELHDMDTAVASPFGSVEWIVAPDGNSRFLNERVRVELRRGADVRVIGRGKLDEHGRARFDLPQLESMSALSRASSRIHVRPESSKLRITPGTHRRRGDDRWPSMEYVVPPPRPQGDTVTFKLIVPIVGSNVVTGRVLGAEGHPLADAHVTARSDDGGRASGTCTDEDGRFAFPVTKSGVFTVGVRAQDGAWGAIDDVSLRAGARVDLGDMQVAHQETFEGRITYPDGTPVAGVPVVSSWSEIAIVSYVTSGLGCASLKDDTAYTDSNGRYRVRGGESSARRLVWSLRLDYVGGAAHKLEGGYDLKPGDGLDGVLHGHRVRFRVVDESKQPVPGAQIIFHAVRSLGGKKRIRTRPKLTTDLDGRADAWLRPGSAFTTTVIAEGAAPFEREMAAPTSSNESDVELVLQSVDLDTGLRVFLEGPDGASLFPATVGVSTLDGTRVWTRIVKDPGYFVALAPGAYQLGMTSIEKAQWGNKRRGRRWLRFREEVTVEKGRTREVRGQVSAAAHLHVSLRLKGKVNDSVGTYTYPKVFLVHLDTGRREQTSIRVGRDRGSGSDVIRRELEPGLWDVRAEAQGFASLTRRIDLKAGVLNQLDFELNRE